MVHIKLNISLDINNWSLLETKQIIHIKWVKVKYTIQGGAISSYRTSTGTTGKKELFFFFELLIVTINVVEYKQ